MIVSAQFGDQRVPDRRWRKVSPCPATGCWLWTGKTSGNGYGRVPSSGSATSAHGYFYSTLIGPYGAGLDLDHLCRNRSCVNPYHLEPVTRSENLRRGANGDVIRARTSQIACCPSGHPYDAANTYFRPGTKHRDCLTCRRNRSTAYNRRISDMSRQRREIQR